MVRQPAPVPYMLSVSTEDSAPFPPGGPNSSDISATPTAAVDRRMRLSCRHQLFPVQFIFSKALGKAKNKAGSGIGHPGPFVALTHHGASIMAHLFLAAKAMPAREGLRTYELVHTNRETKFPAGRCRHAFDTMVQLYLLLLLLLYVLLYISDLIS